LYRARAADYKEVDRDNPALYVGKAKPFYEKLIEVTNAKTPPLTAGDKQNLAEAYAYLGGYYQNKEKDDAKATENFTKARENDPTNKQAIYYFQKKAGGKGK
jgi:hypothetical protein